MKQFTLVAAVVAMAATGCVNSNQFLKKNSMAANQMAPAQSAPTGGVQQVSYDAPKKGGSKILLTGGLFGKKKSNCCESSCGCDDICCESTCGCADQCCESTCGCPEGCGAGCCQGYNGPFHRGSYCNGCGPCGNGACGNGCYGDCYGCRPGQGMVNCIASGGCGGAGYCGHCGCCDPTGPLCPHSFGYPAATNFTPGPQGGQTAYPYYTTRGPRDFLMCNPQPLGPY